MHRSISMSDVLAVRWRSHPNPLLEGLRTTCNVQRPRRTGATSIKVGSTPSFKEHLSGQDPLWLSPVDSTQVTIVMQTFAKSDDCQTRRLHSRTFRTDVCVVASMFQNVRFGSDRSALRHAFRPSPPAPWPRGTSPSRSYPHPSS
jgi:hypothetical protein